MSFKFKLREIVRIGDLHGHGQIIARTNFSGRRVPAYLVRYPHPVYGDMVTDWFGEHMLFPSAERLAYLEQLGQAYLDALDKQP